MRPALMAATLGLLAAPLAAATVDLTASSGRWVRVFTGDVERLVGRRVLIDADSVVASGTARRFRQAEHLLRDDGGLPQGTTVYMARAVDCQQGLVATTAWSVVARGGAVLGSGSGGGQVARIHWDDRDGKVLRFACTGIQPR